MKNYRTEKFSSNFFADRIEQKTTYFNSHNINEKYIKTMVIPYTIFQTIEVDTYSITDYALKLPIVFIFTKTEKPAYRIKIRTNKLHVIYLYLKEPDCYNYHAAEKILRALNQLKTDSKKNSNFILKSP